MAKVILTLEDGDDGKSVSVRTEFEPELQRGATLTAAQRVAMQLADAFVGRAGVGSLTDALDLQTDDDDDEG